MDAATSRVNEFTGQTLDWRRSVVLASILVAVPLLYWPATGSLLNLWVDGDLTTYTHGYLIAGVCLWLIVRARFGWSRDEQPWMQWQYTLGSIALLGTALLWQFCHRAGIQIGTQLLLLPLLWIAAALLMGRAAARALAFPIGFLVFAIPVWDFFNPLAHHTSVIATQLMLRITGIPAFFENNVVHIPEGTFEIADGCSGLHFLMVSMAVGALLGELRAESWRRRAAWLLGMIALAMVVNWIRVYTIILIGHFSDMQHYIVRESHYYYGWVLFAIALGAVFAIERRIPVLPMKPRESGTGSDGHLAPTAIAGVLACLVLPLVWGNLAASQGPQVAEREPVVPGWRVDALPDSKDWPLQPEADARSHSRVAAPGVALDWYRAAYRDQHVGKELGAFLSFTTGDDLLLESGIENFAGHDFGWLRFGNKAKQSLLWFEFRVDGRRFTSATRAQIWYSWRTLSTGRSTLSEVVAVRADCIPDCVSARRRFAQLAEDGGQL